MYAGHFAAGLAMRSRAPHVPTWVLLVGVGLVDVVFGVLVLVGAEHASVTPGVSPGFRLDFIDWSHSLVASVAWALAFALVLVAAKRGASAATWGAAAVFSHFVLDYPMHPGDLALYPHSAKHFGMGLWREWPVGWWWFELGFVLACLAFYAVRARGDARFGDRRNAVFAVVLVLHVANSPWLSPTG